MGIFRVRLGKWPRSHPKAFKDHAFHLFQRSNFPMVTDPEVPIAPHVIALTEGERNFLAVAIGYAANVLKSTVEGDLATTALTGGVALVAMGLAPDGNYTKADMVSVLEWTRETLQGLMVKAA